MEIVAVIAVALAILHAVSVEMRLTDLTIRLDSAERSLDRLVTVWWEGVAQRHGFSVMREQGQAASTAHHYDKTTGQMR